ncbi:MAG: helix-turn-helix transcriptional regulator [Leptospiraceae bacterium]|nr:helix-turn-helix transcriptional regulator [Leptospiraceae bacterium]
MTEISRTIFKVSQELFALHGFSGVSIRDIASRAKIAKSTVLHHFPNKQKLYEDVVEQSLDEFAKITRDFTAVKGLDVHMKELLRWMLAEPVHAKLLNRVFMDNPRSASLAARKYWKPMLQRLREIDRASKAGSPKKEETILFCINAIFQIAFSIELQLQLLDANKNIEVLLARYSPVIEAALR